MSAKFAEKAQNGLVSFAFTRSTDGQTHTQQTTAELLYPQHNALHGDNNGKVRDVCCLTIRWNISEMIFCS